MAKFPDIVLQTLWKAYKNLQVFQKVKPKYVLFFFFWVIEVLGGEDGDPL